MPVNLDADIRNADWTKTTNDLPAFHRREELAAVVRDISHWLRDLPSANAEAVSSVWQFLTEDERAIYNARRHNESRRGDPILRDGGLVVLSLRAGGTSDNQSTPIAQALVSAFDHAASRFADDADTDAIERSLVGLSDHLLESLTDSYIPAVVDLVLEAEDSAAAALVAARRRSLAAFRSAARRPRTSASVAAARRYALNRALLLVDDLSATARTAARDILSRDDLRESTRVRRLKAVLGLNERQHDTYMRNLADISSARGTTIDLGTFGVVDVPVGGLDGPRFQALADRYASHLLHQRATLVSKTEGTTIREEARRALWEREAGDDVEFVWVANDENCAQCQALDGTAVRAGEEYAPDVLTPPAHPGCDCTQGVRIH